ncbi:MAG: putative toxin-antitoxin system toxin component, PIN family [Sulfuriferula sp.]|nr:putative toxin-antitoxin system toxin component, PIN family [Sulfuriferula sp.]
MSSDRKKIVFDTSSLIPVCLHPTREPAQIFKRAVMDHELFSSPETLRELQLVLTRDKFEAWQPLVQRIAWARLYQDVTISIAPQDSVTDCRDVKDNKFLELAIAANADIIISSDIHLLELHPYHGIEIIKLSEFKLKYHQD